VRYMIPLLQESMPAVAERDLGRIAVQLLKLALRR